MMRWIALASIATIVLTVAETSGFAEMGGVINFQVVDSKVHFEVNIGAADRSHMMRTRRLVVHRS